MSQYENASLEELAKTAVTVQDAVNLSGIVYSYADTLKRLRVLIPGKDTEFYNTHPLAVLYSSKIESLTGSTIASKFSDAYNWACDLTGA